MIITCPCGEKKFEVAESLIPEKGRLLKCGSCEHTWFFDKKNHQYSIFDESEAIAESSINTNKEKAKQIKIIIKSSPEILLANRDPNNEPDIIPNIHFFTILIFVLPNFRWVLIDDSEVKQITPSDEATATCITISVEYPKLIRMKYVIGTIIIPPPTPSRPAKNPDNKPVDKNINIRCVNNFSVLKVLIV